MTNVIDLDVVLPPSATIKFENQEIIVNPLTVAQTIRIGNLYEKLLDKDSPIDQIQRNVDEMTIFFYEHIPALSGKVLSKAQLEKLVMICVDLNTPQEKKDLEASGVTEDSPGKE